ncbi:amidohydrolase family protein [Novosphingobium rosa]|uniref:amidohydrolase family protein n=1 Tax=Novosphingobium rosa TaxID=76978 RepID=UPI00083547F8|nr:amidohydrolase family protein [Novosphingobium rosa]
MRTLLRLAASASLGALLSVSIAQAQPAGQIVALRHARVIDGNGGAPKAAQTILIEQHRIRAVGPDARVTLPKAARVIDLTGQTVLPGLISDHSHLAYTDGATSGPQNYTRDNAVRELKQWQRYGVTTITSLGLNAPLFYEMQPQAHAGSLGGADFFGADRGIGVPEGAPTMTAAADQLYRPTTVEEARADVDETAARHPSFIKVWVDDFHHAVPARMKPEIYKAVIEEAHAKGLRVAAHVYYREDARKLVEAGADVLAHGVRDELVDADLIALMKRRGTWYIPTLGLDESFYIYAQHPEWLKSGFFRGALQPALATQLADPAWQAKALDPKALAMNQASLAINKSNLLTLYRAGVKIGFGTDSGATPLRIPGIAEQRELVLMVQAGLTPLQAITVATRDAAALLDLTDRGMIAPGKRADLLVVAGDPARNITDTTHIRSVWEAGQEVVSNAAPRPRP